MQTPDSPSAQIASLLYQLGELQGAAPFQALTPGQRRELGGRLFPEGPGLVHAVGAALAGQPGLFPDLAAAGAALLEKQRLAARWLAVRERLREMERLAADSHLALQSEAISEAQEIVRQVRAAPGHTPRGAARNTALVSAYLLVHRYYGRLEERKDELRAHRKAKAPATAPRPLSPAKLRARRAERQLRRAGLHGAFAAFLAPPPPRSMIPTPAGPAAGVAVPLGLSPAAPGPAGPAGMPASLTALVETLGSAEREALRRLLR